MNRRDFLTLTAAVTLAAPMGARPALAQTMAYTPGAVHRALAEGKTVIVDFHASWCTTCRAQDRVLRMLKAGDPAYDTHLAFFVVDWDTYRDGKLARALNVAQRSTLVALKGDRELGRLVAQTGRKPIKALLDRALKAAAA